MKKIIALLVFGVDTSIGIASCAILGFLFGVQPETLLEYAEYLAFAGFFAYLPDLDLLIYLPLRRRYGWVEHWFLFHHPAIVVPFATLLGTATSAWLAPAEMVFLTSLATTCTFLHFVHDSVEKIGLPWFSPFNKKFRITLAGGTPRIAPPEMWEEMKAGYRANLKKSTAEQVAAFSDRIDGTTLVIWCCAVLLFLGWVAWSL